MALCAFHGSPALRDAALGRLANHVEQGELVAGIFQWTGTAGSLAACLIDGNDPQRWVDQLGLPNWLAPAIDTVAGSLPPARGLIKVRAMLQAIAPGSDLERCGSRMIGQVLDQAVGTLIDPPLPEAGAMALQQVGELHRRCVAGDTVGTSAWRQARKAAMAATDAVLEQPGLHAAIRCIEAAAWDPATSPSAVSEVLRAWMALESLKADAEYGWTRAHNDHIQALLDALYLKYLHNNPQPQRDVFYFLEQDHPDDAARLRDYIKFGREFYATCADRACELVVRLLGACA